MMYYKSRIKGIVLLLLSSFVMLTANGYAGEQNLTEHFWHQAANCLSPGMFPDSSIYQETGVGYCGTPYMLLLANKDIEAPAYMDPLAQRPSLSFSYDTPQGNFKIHYDTSGTNAVLNPGVDVDPADGVPDYVNFVGDICEHCWAYEIDTMGYTTPPSDSFYAGGGDGRYDFYLVDLGGGLFGQTVPDSVYDYPKYTSFIELDNDYSWYLGGYQAAIEVTTAHEFFHSIQMGYDATEYPNSYPYSTWWFECTAVWMEEQVYDEVNDYLNYLPYFYNYPARGLTASGSDNALALHKYASCVWPLYLSERFDQQIIKGMWEQCGESPGYNVINAMDLVLTNPIYGSNLDRAFGEFATWNYFTGSRADTIHQGVTFSEAARYPLIPDSLIKFFYTYPDTVLAGNEFPSPPEFLAANYIDFKVIADSIGGVWVGFNGDDRVVWEIPLMGVNPFSTVNPPTINYIELDTDGVGADTMWGWTKYTDVLFIPCAVGTHDYTFDPTYSYVVQYDSSLGGEEPTPETNKIYGNFPNPLDFNKGESGTYFKFELIKSARPIIKIYNTAGDLVRELEPQSSGKLPPGIYERQLYWDGRNDRGALVAGGVYIYHFYTDDVSQIKKLLVIR